MAKRQSTYRVSPYTERIMDKLVSITGMTKTEIISQSLSNMYDKLHKENKMDTNKMANEIYDLVYTGDDKYHRASKTSEIQDWLDDGSLIGDETAEQLAHEWNEYDQEPEKDEIE